MGQFGSTELLIVALIIIVFFGGKRVPEFIKGIGEAVKEFKKSASEETKG